MSARPPSLIDRLKQARIVQVLLVYLGASWVVLQIADVLQNTAGLPTWVGALALLLLLIGLIIILATAWVQAQPSTTAAEEAGEIPTDWEIAPADVIQSLRSGQLPHLTWGRAILGGVVALSLLFGGAGLYVGLTGRPGILGPQEVGADEAAAGIAVVPFSVTGGTELELWREGMVDLLATNLDGMGGYRTIDSRTVMAQWRDRVEGDDVPDLRTSLEVAAQTGARYALVGALVGNPAGIRLSADLYDLSSGDKVAQVSQEGPADDVLDLTSALSVDLTRELLGGGTGQGMVQDVRLNALTTTSLPSLRAYLEGESAFRSADFAAAVASYERAVELDSLFALAWLRLSNSYGWLDNIGSAAGARAGERALALVDRLPARDRILVRASEAVRTGDPTYFADVQEGVRLYPDDPDLWFELGEYIYHVGLETGVATLHQAVEAFGQAVELDPGFGPYRVHALELTIASGDRAAAEADLERYRSSTEDVRYVTEFELAIPLLLGSDQEAAEAIEASREVAIGVINRIRISFANRQDRYDRLRDLLWANRDRAGSDHQWMFYMLGAEGALDRAARLTDTLDLPISIKSLGAGWMLGGWSTAAETDLRQLARPGDCEQPALNTSCLLFVGWGLARSGDLRGARETLGKIRSWAAEAEGPTAQVRTEYGDAVEGTIAAEEGRVADARRLLGPVASGPGVQGDLARATLAEVETAEGNSTEAIRYYSGNLYTFNRFHSQLGLARLHDDRGDADQARTYYRSFLTITREGNQDLPEIMEAREALERLGG
jgi:tetratricopeptide (TPR) repeat protein/TolB-like protein